MRETGDRILDAAFVHFSTSHFVDVTVASIAEAAGCSEQTVYRRYTSKEGLFRALADRVGATIRGGRAAIPAGDVAAAVERAVEDYETGGDAMILMQAQEDRVDIIAQGTARGRNQHHDWVSRVFAEPLARLEPATRRRVHGELVVALDVQTWKRLRRDLEFSREMTARAMTEMIRGILSNLSSATKSREKT